MSWNAAKNLYNIQQRYKNSGQTRAARILYGVILVTLTMLLAPVALGEDSFHEYHHKHGNTLDKSNPHKNRPNTNNPKKIDKGIFLVATGQLDSSSFKRTVILITHNSIRGTTGIAINRPSAVALRDAFPNQEQFRKYEGDLFLGGPVNTNSIFLLINTEKPTAGMYRVADGLYFTRDLDMLRKNIDIYSNDGHARAYAGYAGWAPGQLQNEIDRGDWTIVRTNPSVVFESDHTGLWERLNRNFSGNWI